MKSTFNYVIIFVLFLGETDANAQKLKVKVSKQVMLKSRLRSKIHSLYFQRLSDRP